MAYNVDTGKIFVGSINVFGYFNEVDFLMDDVIGHLIRSNSSSAAK